MEITISTQSETQTELKMLAWKPALCSVCGQPYASRKALRVHDSMAHRSLVRKRAKRKPQHSRNRALKKKGVTPRGEQSCPVSVHVVSEAVS